MSTIITVYSHNAFKGFLLPAINDADYSILLVESLFNIPQNIELKLEISDNRWFFAPSDDYDIELLTGNGDCYLQSLDEFVQFGNNEFRLLQDKKHILSLSINISDDYFSVYEKYDLQDVTSEITIGRNESSTICFGMYGKQLVSSCHAKIYQSGESFVFQDNESANGSFLNNKRVKGSENLKFGDCIDIFGLRIVFLGDAIAINVSECGAVVDERILKKIIIESAPLQKVNRKSLTTVFHRSPRRLTRIEDDTVKIDDPPTPKDEVRNRGVLAAIGSAMVMALPMLLGCAFMIYASQVSGMSRGLFMYIGLVTSVSSATIGAIRGIVGIRKAVREYKEYEEKRNKKYGEYLKKQENIIKEKYEKNTNSLRDRYVSAKECCSYNASNMLLWCRNATQSDFLTHRLGIGDLPFQVEIEIPEQKFTMSENSLTEIPANLKKSYSMLHDVPICVDLFKEKLVGVIGGRRMEGGITVVRNLIAQIAANNSYTDVKIVFIYDEKKSVIGREWDFVKWLPHVWNETKTFRYVANGKESASEVFYELNRILRQRIDDSSSRNCEGVVPKPYYVVVLASHELMEGEIISKYVLSPSPEYGISCIYMAQRYEDLPNQCEYIIENDENYSGCYRTTDDYEDRIKTEFDEVDVSEISAFAEKIANVEVQEIEVGGDVPVSISFFEMYGAKRLEDFDIENRWKKNRTYESMKALVGQKAGGVPCFLDIHEKYHGPHGLVAGTTGSGKSETLQTYMLSLAINFSPDDVSFFVIDYKGGGMANLFIDLPHMVGQISNLSGNQIQRALMSIQSEKDRREALFASFGVKDIRDYTKVYKNNEATVPLPHLIIVIDEFAEMKKEEPEFIQEIVSISRVGRSLGIHLIMATQKPAGSVSDDIWSNSRFKLCLRVQSKQDSMDMLHKPDAAYLTQSGRCYLQVGNDELYELFQSGFSGATYYDDEADVNTGVATMLEINGIPSLEGNHARSVRQKEKKKLWLEQLENAIQPIVGEDSSRLANLSRIEKGQIAEKVISNLISKGIDYSNTDNNRENLITLLEEIGIYGYDSEAILKAESEFTNAKKKLPQQPEHTQLEAVVRYIDYLAKKNGFNHDFSLFLPLLPSVVYLSQLPKGPGFDTEELFNGISWQEHGNSSRLEICMGLYDDPENQRQDAFVLDIAKMGNIILLGAPTSGKSTFLQTFVFGMMMKYSPAEVNFYILEFSARKFSVFESAPHIGGIVKENDGNERIEKLFSLMLRILNERKEVLGDIGFVQYCEAHGQGKIPAIVLVIDNYASFLNKTGDAYIHVIQKLVKEGAGCGIFMLVSATGIGSGEISNSVAQNFRMPICLELNNVYDYSNYLRVPRVRINPESGVKGRGLGKVGDRILEFQTAIMLEADNENDMNQKASKIAKDMLDVWEKSGNDSARKIPEIPAEPEWNSFIDSPEVRTMFETDNLLPVGYETRFAESYGIDLSKLYVYLITGGKKKGKTNALKILTCSAIVKGGNAVIVDFDKHLKGFADNVGAKCIQSEVEWASFISNLLKNDLVTRNADKAELMKGNAQDSEIFKFMQKYRKIFIFIENLPLFVERMQRPTEENVPANVMLNMEMVIERGALHNIYWFATVDKDNLGTVTAINLYKLFVRDRKGMHLGGMVHSTSVANMNFDNHDRKTLDAPKAPGRAMLPLDNEESVKEVVIPLYKGR
ncbi:type VII secretion protein EssC [Butyrivibrio sp. YAB3001]|uniref:type VII secretion protein EssC n=1 Tax=Butyrivibrio sp. YAB3001 TaxID=1520812 RepID=UPI0008F62559|nr:type VII secretion protein EssC [Butyrivibrio sp. YAB3001]SFB82492.1 DNA segregation ATPase FtsK/SpoIIIE, S-DNA-T family [Butyrivibrio sp. YAB3001]